MRAMVLALLLAAPLSAAAQAERDPNVATPESANLGVLRFRVDPLARVTVDRALDDRILSLVFSRQESPLAAQLRGTETPGLVGFSVVPLRSSQRLDLRLANAVRGAEVIRRGADIIEVQFSTRPFAGASLRVRRAQEERQGQLKDTNLDQGLQAVLAETLQTVAPEWIDLDPFLLPVGRTGPVRQEVLYKREGRTWGIVPPVVRDAWATDDVLRNAVIQAESGKPLKAAQALYGYPNPDDAAAALLALARGWIWSQPIGPHRKPANAGRAGEAFQLAAALAPDSDWAPWASARAAYHYEWESRYDESLLLYRRAISGAPDHPERIHWEIGIGMALIGRGRYEEGVAQVASWLGGLGGHEEQARFEGRRAVLYALWALGDVVRAARVFDLIRDQHPTLSTEPERTQNWAMLLLDAGRYPEAREHLDTLEVAADRRVVRERARWWSHEASLAMKDVLEARRALRRILEQTPGSALGPLARLRLQTLDLWSATPEEREMSWPEFSLVLQKQALLWPNTSLELEALSLSAQIWFDAGMIEDGLRLYDWIEGRGGSTRGAIAYDRVVCEHAPMAFRTLRARGHDLAALGLWRTHLEQPERRACVDPEVRAQAVETALSSGLPDLALDWVGKAVIEGQKAEDDAAHLLLMAQTYLRQGRPEAARRTLRFIEADELPVKPGPLAEAWGDLLLKEGDAAGAAERYGEALSVVSTPERVAHLTMRRGVAWDRAGRPDLAERDLLAGLEAGASEDAAGAWVLLASIRQDRAEAESDASLAPLTPRAREAWSATLTAASQALEASPQPSQTRAATWHRASALLGLGRADDAEPLMQNLMEGDDAWALLAKNRQSGLSLEQSLDEQTTER